MLLQVGAKRPDLLTRLDDPNILQLGGELPPVFTLEADRRPHNQIIDKELQLLMFYVLMIPSTIAIRPATITPI